MHLKEYIDRHHISLLSVAKRLNVSHTCVRHIVNGGDVKLSTAMELEKITFGEVKPKDMYEYFINYSGKKTYNAKNEKNGSAQQEQQNDSKP